MQNVSASFIAFLAILNPFALCLYLEGVMSDLEPRDFYKVLFYASLMSFIAFVAFALAGEPLLNNILGIEPEALQVFGGIIIAIVAYGFVTKGYRTMVMMTGQLDEMPSAIAVPFMIGAGTIMQAIFIGQDHPPLTGIGILAAGMVLCYATVLVYQQIRDRVRRKYARVFDRYVNIIARINGLLVGALATNMVIDGLHTIWESPLK